MSSRFVGGSVWDDVTDVCTSRGRRQAAVAFVGEGAPERLPLRSGDLLIVNAGDGALKARSTNPEALATYVNQGVHVYSSSRLHAKVIVTRKHAVIGSANASSNSAKIDEAVLITDDEAIRKEAADFIKKLGGLTKVDEVFLAAARQKWDRGRFSTAPGSDTDADVDDFLPSPPYRFGIMPSTPWSVPDDVYEDLVAHRGKARKDAGRAADFILETWRVDGAGDALHIDDVFCPLAADENGWWLSPPEVVITEPIRPPRKRYFVQYTKGRVDLEPLPIDDAKAKLRASRIRLNLEDGGDIRWTSTKAQRVAVLRLWDL